MAFQRGDVVLVPFPLIDLSAQRVRPALVVSTPDYEQQTGDIIVAQITSKQRSLPTDYTLQDRQAAGLLETICRSGQTGDDKASLVQFRPGRLSDRDLQEFDKRLKTALGL